MPYRAPAAWWATFLLFTFSIISYIDRWAIAVVAEPIKIQYGLSDTEVSLLLGSAAAVFYLIVALPFGLLADRVNRRNLIVITLLIVSAMTAAGPFAALFGVFLLFRLAPGLMDAAASPPSFSMLHDMFPLEKRPAPLALLQTGAPLGATIALLAGSLILTAMSGMETVPIPLIGDLRPWQAVIFLCSLPGFILALLFLVTVPEPKRGTHDAASPGSERDSVGQVFSYLVQNRMIYGAFFVGSALAYVAVNGLGLWGITHLGRAYGMSPADAGFYAGIFTGTSIIAGVLIGPLLGARLVRGRRTDGYVLVAIIGVTGGFGAAILSGVAPTATLSIAAGAVTQIFANAAGQVPFAVMQAITPGRMQGIGAALYIMMIVVFGFILGPVMVGFLSDTAFTGAFGLGHSVAASCAACLPISLLLLFMSRKAVAAAFKGVAVEQAARNVDKKALVS